MEPRLELVAIWEDEDLFEVRVSASNGKFAGETCCYTLREEIAGLGGLLTGFPKGPAETFQFTSADAANSHFTLQGCCRDALGHLSVRIKLVERWFSASQVEFELKVEPAAVDRFASALMHLSTAGVGEVSAVLLGHVDQRLG